MNQELHPICHKLLANDVINWVDGKIVKKLCLKARWSVEGLLTGKQHFMEKVLPQQCLWQNTSVAESSFVIPDSHDTTSIIYNSILRGGIFITVSADRRQFFSFKLRSKRHETRSPPRSSWNYASDRHCALSETSNAFHILPKSRYE